MSTVILGDHQNVVSLRCCPRKCGGGNRRLWASTESRLDPRLVRTRWCRWKVGWKARCWSMPENASIIPTRRRSGQRTRTAAGTWSMPERICHPSTETRRYACFHAYMFTMDWISSSSSSLLPSLSKDTNVWNNVLNQKSKIAQHLLRIRDRTILAPSGYRVTVNAFVYYCITNTFPCLVYVTK